MFIFRLFRAAFWHNLRRYDRRTETKEKRKRTRTTKQYTSNSSNLVEEVTPEILFLDTKPFAIFTDVLLQLDAYFKKSGLINRFFLTKLEFLFSTRIK